ncbi:hypothetical protein DERF_006877 [Dermatophagoides farinae]|uniref:Uncharacterized protein n=1 Tax=Dermatophagoides farinae TaxID=6954 RepID=A0A922L3Y7_DERFA|nr:hypothetical protein DERF_006877 [Dermatophagoides farinae]
MKYDASQPTGKTISHLFNLSTNIVTHIIVICLPLFINFSVMIVVMDTVIACTLFLFNLCAHNGGH